MATSKKIMAWSKCGFSIGKTADDGTMSTPLTSIGTIKYQSSSLEASEGDTLEMQETGGAYVAKETMEGSYKATTRVIEPTDELLTLLGIGTAESASKEFKVATHVVDGDWSLQITPKNVGARGIKAPKTNITYVPGWSEEDGNYADLTFDILKGDADYWYSIFTKTE